MDILQPHFSESELIVPLECDFVLPSGAASRYTNNMVEDVELGANKMRGVVLIAAASFCIPAHAEVPPYSGILYVDSDMPNDVYTALVSEVNAQEDLSVVADCNIAQSILLYRADRSKPLQLIDKTGANLLWSSKLDTKRLPRSARSALSDLNDDVRTANKEEFSQTVDAILNGGSIGNDAADRLFTNQWEYFKKIDQMTDEVTVVIRHKESVYGTTLMFSKHRGLLSFVSSTFYRPDPNGDAIQIRIGENPHLTIAAEYDETSIVFDLPNGFLNQLQNGGDILLRWHGYLSVPEDVRRSADFSEVGQDSMEETTKYPKRKLTAAVHSLLTDECMYLYEQAR